MEPEVKEAFSSTLAMPPMSELSIGERFGAKIWCIVVYFKMHYINLLQTVWFFRGPHSTMDSVLASHPAAPGLILGIPKKFSLREFFSWYSRDLLTALHCLFSGQCRSLIVDRTHLVLLDCTTKKKFDILEKKVFNYMRAKAVCFKQWLKGEQAHVAIDLVLRTFQNFLAAIRIWWKIQNSFCYIRNFVLQCFFPLYCEI